MAKKPTRPARSRPVYFGSRRSTRDDAKRVLKRIGKYTAVAGWSPDLRETADAWLDCAIALGSRAPKTLEHETATKGVPSASS